jgi:hypothetical protein
MDDVEKIKHDVENRIKQALLPYVGNKATGDRVQEMIKQIKAIVSDQVKHFFGAKIDDNAVSFEVDPNDNSAMIPANLYTLLLMQGIVVDYAVVKGKTEYELPNGDVVVFRPHSADHILRSNMGL